MFGEMEQDNPVNCLFCHASLGDVKPVVEGEKTDLLKEFRKLFVCFYRLLDNHGDREDVLGAENTFDKVLGNWGIHVASATTSPAPARKKRRRNVEQMAASSSSGFQDPCCGECWEVLKDIFQLQQAVDEIKTMQMAHVEKLKTSLNYTADLDEMDSMSSQLRKQLLSCSRSRPTQDEVATPVSKRTSSQMPKRKSVQVKPGCGIAEMAVNFLRQKIHTPPVAPVPTPAPKARRSRKKRVAFKDPLSDTNEDYTPDFNSPPSSPLQGPSPSSSPPLQYPITKPCSVILERIYIPSSVVGSTFLVPEADDDIEGEMDEQVLVEDSTPPSVPASPGVVDNPGPVTPSFGARVNKLFWAVDDTTLLYKFFLIAVSQGGTQLSCSEPDCDTAFQNPNPSLAFAEMASHMERDHLANLDPATLKVSGIRRNCPFAFCAMEFEPDELKEFRNHLLRDHLVEKVVCEICWKPMKNVADCYKRHKWHHKSDQEKVECEDGVPKQIVYKALQSRNGRARKKLAKLGLLQKALEEPRSTGPTLRCRPAPLSKRKPIVPPARNAEPAPYKLRYRVNQMFTVINETTLLCKFSLIQVSHGGTHLTCLEPECHVTCQDVNYLALFEKMASHVDTCHSVPAPGEEPDVKLEPRVHKICPVPECEAVFDDSPTFRAHLIRGHNLIWVTCEICWRPLKNESDIYRRHRWSHKSEQEQKDSEEGPPRQLIYKALRSKKGKQRSYFQRLGILQKFSRKKKKAKVAPKKGKRAKQKKKVEEEDDDSEWEMKEEEESEEEMVKVKVEKKVRKKRKRASRLFGIIGKEFGIEHVYELVTDTLYIYKYTLFRTLPGTGFSCEEPHCSHVIPGSWNSETLTAVKEHVDSVHIDSAKEDSRYSTQVRRCPLCIEGPKNLDDGPEFRKHLMKENHERGRYKCECCGLPMQTLVGMDKHLWSHKSEEEKALCEEVPPVVPKGRNSSKAFGFYPCPTCGRVFHALHNLNCHLPTHLPKEQRPQLLCPECPDRFLSKPALRNHLEKIHHPELTTYNYCPICNKKFYFRRTTGLQRHIQSHTNVRPTFVCDLCGKVLTSESTFRSHMITLHENVKVFQCEFCHMSYRHRSNLRRHLHTVHADKVTVPTLEEKLRFTAQEFRPDFIGPKIAYPCPFCEKAFPLRSRMTKHQKICAAARGLKEETGEEEGVLEQN